MGIYCFFFCSGVREEADGSVTYCLMGNGLTIMADEEYLTISSTLEPSHMTTHTTASSLAALRPQTSNTSSALGSPHLGLGPHAPTTSISPLCLSSDTPTTCPLAQPLTTQPPKAKHHPIQQGLLPSHYKVMSQNGRPVVPPPQLPAIPQTPITAQVVSSIPPCASPPAPTLPPASVLPPPVQSHTQLREEPERKEREYRDDDDDDVDEEEEESRRKVRSVV